MTDKPEYNKQYSLTGGKGQPSIMNGNTWEESEIKEPKDVGISDYIVSYKETKKCKV